MAVKVGDKVAAYGYPATVKYVGTFPAHKGTHRGAGRLSGPVVGVEFHKRGLGDCDGAYQGSRYFQCAPGMGRFVRAFSVKPFSRETCAAIRIQTAYRRFRAAESFQELAAFRFWNELDHFEEKDALVNNRQVGDVGTPTLNTIKKQIHEEDILDLSDVPSEMSHAHASSLQVPSASGGPVPGGRMARRRSSTRRSQQRQSVDASAYAEEDLPAGYRGPHLRWPVTRQFALDLLDHFREHSDVLLPRKYAMELAMAIEDHYKQTMKGAVAEVEIPKKPGARLVLVGDTHGQLNDVIWILYKFGPPSPINVYLFNGDIADRGRSSVEIFLLLFAFKLSCPGSVIINRGNHESADMNEVYGFAQEVRQKYGGMLYQKFQDIFHLLPLCVVLEKRVFIVHGGLCRRDNITLQHIDKLHRQRPCPASPQTFEDTLMFDLLWSDPQPDRGRGWSTRGADCIAFGPDVTDAFLTKNNLEVPTNLRGFEPVHDGRCVTLFSASNYCGTTGNYGGVIIFEANLSFEIQEYMAPTLQEIHQLHHETCAATMKVLLQKKMKELETQAKRANRRSAAARLGHEIVQKMCKMVCEKKQDLWWCFFNMDSEGSGKITPAQWREACSIVFGQELPWVNIMKCLRAVNKDGVVHYNDFLGRYKVDFRPPACKHLNWRQECVARVFESIMSADLSLKETLMLFDRNCDGTVSFREFNELLSELDIGLSEPQVRILMRLITASPAFNAAAGSIDVAEFLGRFKVVYSNSIKEDPQAKTPWLTRALHCIGKAILADKAEAASRHYEQQQLQDGGLLGEGGSRRRSSAVRAVALFQKFKDYNEGGDGYLSYDDFVSGIKRLNIDEEELGFALTDSHLYRANVLSRQVAEAIDLTGSKRINYLEFLQAFHVVDSSSNNNLAEELWGQICTTLFQHSNSIRRALHQFDPDLTGKVDSEDFRSALVTLNTVLARTEAPLTEEQIDQLVNFMDLDSEGMVEYEEFLDSFIPVDSYCSVTGGLPSPPDTSTDDSSGGAPNDDNISGKPGAQSKDSAPTQTPSAAAASGGKRSKQPMEVDGTRRFTFSSQVDGDAR
ncbi:hypothetical protein Efla_003887 [Eimeria flavescens]